MNLLINHQSIEESCEILSDIIKTILDYIWEIDIEGKYKYLSPQFEKITGFGVEEAYDKTIYDFIPQSEIRRVNSIMKEHFKNKTQIKSLIVEKKHKNGTQLFVEITGNPIFNKHNEFIGFRGTTRDITDKVNLEKELQENYKKINELNKKLEIKIKEELAKNSEKDLQLFSQSKMATMGEMITNIAHQWRQPLSAITTLASGVKLFQELNKKQSDKEIAETMDNILIKANYLSGTIDTFMKFIKDKKEYRYESIKKIVTDSIFMVNNSLENNFINLETNLNDFEDFKIESNPNELIEVLINILSNAKDALKTRKERRKIIIIISKNNEEIIIKILDNGGGIPANIIDKIYEPYFTTKNKEHGTGVGLNMSYRIVTESLKGEISAKNKNDGAQFTIKLPITRKG